MISIDTNNLFHAFNADAPHHGKAYNWVAALGDSERVAISEFVLAELYRLIRNPMMSSRTRYARTSSGVSCFSIRTRWR